MMFGRLQVLDTHQLCIFSATDYLCCIWRLVDSFLAPSAPGEGFGRYVYDTLGKGSEPVITIPGPGFDFVRNGLGSIVGPTCSGVVERLGDLARMERRRDWDKMGVDERALFHILVEKAFTEKTGKGEDFFNSNWFDSFQKSDSQNSFTIPSTI